MKIDFDLGEEIHVEGTTDVDEEESTSHPELETAEETEPTPQGRKIVTLKKPFSSRASEKAQSLILDCVASLPDQEQLGEPVRHSQKVETLCGQESKVVQFKLLFFQKV